MVEDKATAADFVLAPVDLTLIVDAGSVVKYGEDPPGSDLTCDGTTCVVSYDLDQFGNASVVLEATVPLSLSPHWVGPDCDEGHQYYSTCSFILSDNATMELFAETIN